MCTPHHDKNWKYVRAVLKKLLLFLLSDSIVIGRKSPFVEALLVSMAAFVRKGITILVYNTIARDMF